MIFDATLKQATALHRAGDLRRAVQLYEEALSAEPENAELLQLAGVAYTQLKDYRKAVDRLRRCVSFAPSSDATNSLGLALFASGASKEAIARFEQALALDSRNAKAANNLGNVLFAEKDLAGAGNAFRQALSIRPDYTEARSNLGQCFLVAGRAEEAVREFDAALQGNENYRPALDGLSKAYASLERFDELVATRRRILGSSPHEPQLIAELGLALQTAGRHAEAIETFGSLVRLQPDNANRFAQLGVALLESGLLDAAYDTFAGACRLKPDWAYAWHHLVRVRKVVRADQSLNGLKQLLKRAHGLSPGESIHLHFALGKALADIGEPREAFDHYLEGNRINRGRAKYAEAPTLDEIAKTKSLFTQVAVQLLSGKGDTDRAPVFILGMPRTGSTLVEQILAAHPEVVTIGESVALRDAVLGIGRKKRLPYPDLAAGLSETDLKEIGERYATRVDAVVRARGGDLPCIETLRVVDKMPGNYLFLGLIYLAFPNARIIHTKRDPIETCLSCFRTHFDSLGYASDLGELGRYFRAYEDLMQHWKDVLPDGSILDVQYEDLVRGPERGARDIVAHCGLNWNEKCLTFHANAGPVSTASAAQVRNPIYDSSLRSWRPSPQVLKPLLDALNLTTDTGASLDS